MFSSLEQIKTIEISIIVSIDRWLQINLKLAIVTWNPAYTGGIDILLSINRRELLLLISIFDNYFITIILPLIFLG